MFANQLQRKTCLVRMTGGYGKSFQTQFTGLDVDYFLKQTGLLTGITDQQNIRLPGMFDGSSYFMIQGNMLEVFTTIGYEKCIIRLLWIGWNFYRSCLATVTQGQIRQ